jgi:hypothetical protein
MLAVSPYAEFVDKSNEAADLLLWVKYQYLKINKFLGKFVAYILLLGIGVFLYLFFIWLKTRLKTMYKRQYLTITVDNYKELRLFYDKLTPSVSVFKEINIIALHKKMPFFARLAFGQLKKITDVIIAQHEKLARDIDSLDSTAIKGSKFMAIPEKELWKNRITAYNYLA